MKLAFFSPLNPIQSGISDYSEELLLTLVTARINGQPPHIDLFIDRGYRPSNPAITRHFHILPGRDFARMASRYDSILYQMGNSPAHAYIYDQLLRHPGVVVMHEFVLHHLRQWMALNRGRRKAYLSLMEREHGEEGREVARRVALGQFPEALFNYPLSDEAINRAQAVIVHSEYMAGLVRGVRPDMPLSVVPMGVPLPPLIPKAEARARLGLDPDTFLVTSVGHLNPYKRVPATLRAFKALLMDVPDSLYLLVGSQSPHFNPTRQVEMLGLTGKVRATGYVSQHDFNYYLAATDVCINLRYPTAGETSAALLRIMGAGVPVLVSRTGSFEELPDDAVGKVDVTDIEEDLLLEYLLLLARRPDLCAAMSANARRHIAEHHTLERAARGYLDFLLSLQGRQAQVAVTPTQVPGFSDQGSALKIRNQQSDIQTPHSALRTPHSTLPDPLSLVAPSAAEIGIEESDEALLAHIARSLKDVI